jgi:hypothetical protein
MKKLLGALLLISFGLVCAAPAQLPTPLAPPAVSGDDFRSRTIFSAPPPAQAQAQARSVPLQAARPSLFTRGGNRRWRGAKPSPRWKAFTTPAHKAQATPSTFFSIPVQLSYWGNDVDGDCVTAEEMFAKAAWAGYVGGSELLFSYDAAVAWASQNGYLNGAALTDVMDSMASTGITLNGTNYTDGGYQAVNWTDDTTLRSAIFTGPVKLGVAADQLDNVVGASNGWFLTGAQTDTNEDHCISLCGFGTITQLAAALNVPVPAGVNGSAIGYGAFTWNTIGILDQQSMIAITSEAWVRSPTTPQQVPAPTPPPTPTPVPTPTPTPSPSPPAPTPAPPSTNSIMIDLTGHAITTPVGFRHSWGTLGDGTITIHPALQTIIVPQNTTINGVKFSN